RRPAPAAQPQQAHQAHAQPAAAVSQLATAEAAEDFDHRPEAPLQARFAALADASPRSTHQTALQARADTAPPRPNRTGLPDTLKSGIESLSGLSMDHVKVHYNSSQPAQLNALAYAQGRDIHVAPGQEKHLPHEAWHVVQQAQGRVKPTMQMAGGVRVNDDVGLEREADLMGGRGEQFNFGDAWMQDHAPSIPFQWSPRERTSGPLPHRLDSSLRIMQFISDTGGVIQRDKTLALGFSELKNDEFGADFLGNSPRSTDSHLSKFRTETGAVGPESLGFNQQADPGGLIQPQFTAGIKAAMASATRICENLAGFTSDQITFAYQHKPELDANEILLLRHHWEGAKRMIAGRIVDTNITGQDGNEWFAMADLIQRPNWDRNNGVPDPTKHPSAWPVHRALISVWELSHQLHNQHLFDKTEFHYFTGHINTRMDKRLLERYGIKLNMQDLMTNRELGLVPPDSGLGELIETVMSVLSF
ncbi:MAG: DUF4157 domain-containing protein, partial [Leptothrix sp. (in: b-proteobacteria)]